MILEIMLTSSTLLLFILILLMLFLINSHKKPRRKVESDINRIKRQILEDSDEDED